MGILEKIRHKMWRTQDVACKGPPLTIVSADNESFEGDDCLLNPIDDRFTLLSLDLRSPRHKFVTSSPASGRSSPSRFFNEGEPLYRERLQDRDDLQLLQDYRYATCGGGVREDDYDDLVQSSDSDDDESDVVGLLAPSHHDSGTNQRRFAYSFDKYEEESIFEPSFEVALLHPDQLTVSIPEPETPLGEAVYIPPNPANNPFPKAIPLPLRRPKPQRRYDKHGRPFLHIFHTGLTTLYETKSNDSSESVGAGSSEDNRGKKMISRPKHPASNVPPLQGSRLQREALTQEFVSEDIIIKARWDYALEKMTHLDVHNFTIRRQHPRRPLSRHRSSAPRASILQEI